MTISELCENVDHHLNGQVSGVALVEDETHIRFECDDWNDPDRRRYFMIRCRGIVEQEVQPEPCEGIDFVEDHPVLWTYHCESCYLHFTSAPANSFEIVGRLVEAHKELMGEWRPFWDYVNTCYIGGLHALLETGRGMLASGPEPLVDAYASAIGDQMKLNVNRTYDIRYNSDRPYRALILDTGYVVCTKALVDETPPRD
jgi:hypothetical protein